jgi:hypothetical protein
MGENEKCTQNYLEYGKNTEKRLKKRPKTLFDLEYGKKY